MAAKLSRQQSIIVESLRSMRWVCGSAWLGQIKDDRRRITDLNRGYMAERGWHIVGEPCKGTACGRSSCPLYKRRAEKIPTPQPIPSNFPYQTPIQFKNQIP